MNPYDPRQWFDSHPASQLFPLYLPHALLLLAPLALLPWPAAAFVALATLFLALMSIAWLGVSTAGIRATPLAVSLSFAFLVLSVPGRSGLLIGNLAVLASTGAAWALAGGPRVAAAGLALAWIKPQVGIPVALAMVALGKWRVAAAGTALALATTTPLAIAVAARSGGILELADVLRANIDRSAEDFYRFDPGPPWPTDIPSTLVRLDLGVSTGTSQVIAASILVLAFVATWILSRTSADSTMVLSGATAATLIALPNFYYAVPVAFVAFLSLAYRAFRERQVPDIVATGLWGVIFLSTPGALDRAGLPLPAFLVLPVGLTALVGVSLWGARGGRPPQKLGTLGV